MGWTHRAAALTLNRYPALGTVPELLERWPALKLEVEKIETELGGPMSELIENKVIVAPSPEGRTTRLVD